MRLFQKVLPGAKRLVLGDTEPEEVEEDTGGFGPPGGVVWTTPVDVLSDRPKSAPAAAPNVPDHATPVAPETPPAEAAVVEAAVPAQQPQVPVSHDLSSPDISSAAFLSGFLGACLVDSESGLMLASAGGDDLDLEAAAALNTQVVRAEHEVIETLGLDDRVEDILITMGKQLHFIRPLEKAPALFLYVALDKKTANLGMARMQVVKIESGLSI